eukprot:Skav230834  [mRNA]  locus=scaffold3318:122228:128753:+ [translate_table: standard]
MGSGGSTASRRQQGCERLGITLQQLHEVDDLVQERYRNEAWPQARGCAVLPAVFSSRHLFGIVVHVDSQREIWKRMWCLSEILASSVEGNDELKLSFVTVDGSSPSSTNPAVFSLCDHPAGTESEHDRMLADANFPLSAFAAHRQIEIQKSCAFFKADEEALLQQILKESGERSGTCPQKHQAYDKANTLLRVKVEAAAMRLAVLLQDEKTQETLLSRAENSSLRSALKNARDEVLQLDVGKAKPPEGSLPGSPLGQPPEVGIPSAVSAVSLPEIPTAPPSPQPLDERAENSKRLGARLGYLLGEFPEAARTGTGQEDPTFHEMSQFLALGSTGMGYNRECPRDRKLHCSIVDALPSKDAQKASHFLSWCWDYHLQMYLKTWGQWRLQYPEIEAFVWQCFFCNNQYRLKEGKKGKKVADESLGEIFQDRLLGIQQMVEMYTAAEHSDKVSVDIILPPDEAADIQGKISTGQWKDIKKKFQEVNVENARAHEPEDEAMVKNHIRNAVGGFQKVNTKVRETMMMRVQQQVNVFLLDDKPARSAADFLQTAGLANYTERLEEQGILTFEAARDELLQLGFKEKLKKLGLAPDMFDGLSEEEADVMRDKRMEERLTNAEDKIKFRHLRQDFLAGEAVVEELVALDMLVARGADWCYDGDSDDDITPEDGGPEGVGRVVAWHSTSGEAVGVGAPRAGWVRVHWHVTGYMRNYRMGTYELPLAQLAFAAAITPSEEAQSLREVPKGQLQLHHLRCSFGYRCGTRFPHYALFDNRPEACEKVAKFRPGDVVEDRDGDRATCIGLKYRPDTKKVDLWFHFRNNEGAGVFRHADHDSVLRKVAQRRVHEAKREDVEGASDGEIDHDEREWVGKNLSTTLRYISKSGQPLHFDIRDEIIQRFKMPYKSGDVLIDRADGEKMTCIGVAHDPMREKRGGRRGRRVVGSVAEVWFHLESSAGAGVSPKMHKALSRFQVVHNEPVRELLGASGSSSDSWDMETALGLMASLHGSLQLDFNFPRGAGKNATPDWFDVRPELVETVVGFKPGTVLTFKGAPPGTRLTLIGLRPDPDSGEVSFAWFSFAKEELLSQLANEPGQLEQLLGALMR